MNYLSLNTLGQLKAAGFGRKSIKEELRQNLIMRLKTHRKEFKGIVGYDKTVIPDLERAVLSRHNIILLGLRGQAKTRLARLMVNLLDEYVPVVHGSEINDDPFAPLSRYARDLVAQHGDDTPIDWLHRNERYTEKLATPDVSIADLIGDIDPIKAANLRLPYSDERVIHFGLVPRSHRGIFVINELPDLQPRIQVALFNILQEGDIQIRGFKVRLPLDIQFVFTANPEDYTNRGSIVTPLKDRIESQILTHYPADIAHSRQITQQEARIKPEQKAAVQVHHIAADLIEQVAFEARNSEYVDAKSGVSARLTISAYENLLSAAERRMLLNNEVATAVRMGDFGGIIPAITGKIELVYEGEQEGPFLVAQKLLSKAIRTLFVQYFPAPGSAKKANNPSVSAKRKTTQEAAATPDANYEAIVRWFEQGQQLDLLADTNHADYQKALQSVSGLSAVVTRFYPKASQLEHLFLMEFVLHGIAEYSLISKAPLSVGFAFKDLLGGMFNFGNDDDEDI